MKTNNPFLLFSIGLPFIWIGLIAGISFLETPLKFTAPGVSLSVGLGIGKVVFTAMKKVEWFLFCLWMVSLVSIPLKQKTILCIFLLFILLVAQSFWLLPQLSQRIDLLQQGIIPPSSFLHTAYVLTEGMKLLFLCYTAFQLFEQIFQSIITKITNNETNIHSGRKLNRTNTKAFNHS